MEQTGGRIEEAMRLAIALDVGGTTVRSGVVTASGDVGGVDEESSPSGAAEDVVLGTLSGIVASRVDAAPPAGVVAALGIAIPGPFDYEQGISHMEHKFASVRGVRLGERIRARTGLDPTFVNDADAFAFGAWWAEHRTARRFLGVTIGTGVGSGFLVDGSPAGPLHGAPPAGEVWNLPFRDGIVEDAVSAGAVCRAHREMGGDDDPSAASVAARAGRGEPAAVGVFARLGAALGEALADVAAGFRPDVVVVGGAVAGSFRLFGPRARDAYASATGRSVPFVRSDLPEPSLLGAGLAALGVIRL